MKNNTWAIGPARNLLKPRFNNIYTYKYLLKKFIQKEIKTQYQQTWLGPIWLLLQPLMNTCIFVFSFAKLAGLSTNGTPATLFYLSGIICWNFFFDCAMKTANTFKDNQQIFSKIYFPRILIPFATICALFLRFSIQFSLLLICVIFYKLSGSNVLFFSKVIMLPLILAIIVALGLGTGLIVSSITVKNRDFSFLFAFSMQLLMYASPVIFSTSAIPSNLKIFVSINPMAAILEGFRFACLGQGQFISSSLCYPAGCSLIVLTVGFLVFQYTEQNFIDTI